MAMKSTKMAVMDKVLQNIGMLRMMSLMGESISTGAFCSLTILNKGWISVCIVAKCDFSWWQGWLHF